MADRSFQITVVNFAREWDRTGLQLDHGIWENDNSLVPPETIPKPTIDDNGDIIPGVVVFGSESNGFATGTEGSVDYSSNAGNMHIGWDNPFVGSNGFGVSVPDGFRADYGDISGNNANVTVNIRKS